MPIQTYEVTLEDGRIVEVDVEAAPSVQAPAEQPSMGGFASNVLSSGAEFIKNIATPFLDPAGTVEGLKNIVREPGLTAQLIRDAAIKRYGSIDAFLNTLYTDPVGAASDASILFGGAGIAAKVSGVGKTARMLSGASEFLNPLAAPAKMMATGGRAAYGAAINPSRRIRRGFPGAIEEGYRRGVLPTEGGLAKTERALEQSAAKTQGLLREADKAGAPRVVAKQITPALAEPMEKARLRAKTGVADDRLGLRARGRAIRQEMAFGQKLESANKIKQEAQTLADSAFRAQERGALIKDLDALADKNVAQAFRKAIEVNAASVGVKGLAESNRKTQSLIGLAQALEDATQQPSRLTHLMSTLGGVGGGIAGGVPGGAGAYAISRLATAKPIMAFSGLTVGKSGKVVRNAQILRALAVIRALEEQPEQRDENQ